MQEHNPIGTKPARKISRRQVLQNVAASIVVLAASGCSVHEPPRTPVDKVFNIPEFKVALTALEGQEVPLRLSFPQPVRPLQAALNPQINNAFPRLQVVTDEVYLPLHDNYPKKGMILLANGDQVPVRQIEAVRADSTFDTSDTVSTTAADKILLEMEPSLSDLAQYRLFANEPSSLLVLYYDRQLSVYELVKNARKYLLTPTRIV